MSQFTEHYNDVIMNAMAPQITSLTIVYSTFYSGTYQRKHQSSASLAFVRGIHRWLGNSPHKGPVTRNMSPFDDVIMICSSSRRTHTSPSPHTLHSVSSVRLHAKWQISGRDHSGQKCRFMWVWLKTYTQPRAFAPLSLLTKLISTPLSCKTHCKVLLAHVK